MEEPNVNKLNGVPNYGHGMPEDGVVVAGVTDIPQEEQIETQPEEEVTEEVTDQPEEEVEITSEEQIG